MHKAKQILHDMMARCKLVSINDVKSPAWIHLLLGVAGSVHDVWNEKEQIRSQVFLFPFQFETATAEAFSPEHEKTPGIF